MGSDLAFACRCGQLRGLLRDIEPAKVNCSACCCAGCQQYARRFGYEDILLDEHNATTVTQIAPSAFEITQGKEHLACLQQTSKGAYRWYAACCRTPLVNTLWTPSVPFVGVLMHACVDAQSLEHPLPFYTGPVRALVNGKFPRKQAKALRATLWPLITMIARLSVIMMGWMWRGEHKRSPFFLPKTKEPILPVEKLFLK
ncbi:MAG: hypothetical protein H6728_02190 [Myxococcales bacterium]|nr:hypothetical protein [Myxococcales bacterium]MCB9641863.1 hypothetical protein [Myxococcales bacterium]